MKTATALGLFDGVHRGHREVLGACLSYAGEKGLSPAVFTFDTGTVTTKGKDFAPIYPESIKRMLIQKAGIEAVHSEDFSAVKDLSPEEFADIYLVKKLDAAAVFCGKDFCFGKSAAGNTETLGLLCRERGIDLHVVEDVMQSGRKVSSTRIRELIREGNIKSADTLLGESYILRGEVVHGRHLGRTQGYPTANIFLEKGTLFPKFGVYAASCELDGRTLYGAANIGVKPTVGSDAALCEINFFDYDGDLYGRVLEIRLIDFVRPELRFSGVDELFERIAYDTKFIHKLIKG